MPPRPFRRFFMLLIVVPVAVVAAAFGVALFQAPSVADLAIRVATLERVNGVRPVRLSRLPATLGEAVVATEDERFYRQSGVDVLALGRAIPFDITHLSLAQGASTITEQLAKIAYLAGNDRSPWRKLTDIALGFRIGHRYDHEQVLSDYLNVAYFGAGAYGVENAAQRYFGRHAMGLDLAQASLLGGLIQAPSQYDPILHPLQARDRQIAVLRSMVRNGYVTEARAAAVVSSPLRLADGRFLPPVRAVSFVPPPPFDWGELAVGALLLGGATAAFVAARLVAPSLALRLSLKVVAALLLLAGALTAAYSVQVV